MLPKATLQPDRAVAEPSSIAYVLFRIRNVFYRPILTTSSVLKRKREDDVLDDPGQHAVKHYKNEKGNATLRWWGVGDLKLRVLRQGIGERKAQEGDRVLLLYEMRKVPSDRPLPSSGSVDGFETIDSRKALGDPVRFYFDISHSEIMQAYTGRDCANQGANGRR